MIAKYDVWFVRFQMVLIFDRIVDVVEQVDKKFEQLFQPTLNLENYFFFVIKRRRRRRNLIIDNDN